MNLFMVSGDTGIARGVENIFRHTLRELSRYWDRIDVCVPPASGAAPTTIFGNVHVHPCDRPKIHFPSFIVEVGQRLLVDGTIDVVCAHSYPFFLNERGAAQVARSAGALYVVEVMHVVGHPRASDLDERLRRLAARLAYARICKPADLVRVINSSEVPEFLCERAGVPRGKILVRSCFYLDFDAFHPPAERSFAGKHVLYSGRLAKNKGLRELCEAVATLRKEREVELTFLGDGELRGKLEQWIKDLGLTDCTQLLGHVPHTELGDLYRAADVLVMCSKNEGGPRVTLEAMACGTPVVSTPVGIMRELIDDGRNGLICGWDSADIAAKLGRVLSDPVLAGKLSRAGPPSVARFEYGVSIREYAEAYLEAARRKRAGLRVHPDLTADWTSVSRSG